MPQHDKRIDEIEKVTFNNSVNFEALLDLMIKKQVIVEKDFTEAKRKLEEKILAAQKKSH